MACKVLAVKPTCFDGLLDWDTKTTVGLAKKRPRKNHMDSWNLNKVSELSNKLERYSELRLQHTIKERNNDKDLDDIEATYGWDSDFECDGDDDDDDDDDSDMDLEMCDNDDKKRKTEFPDIFKKERFTRNKRYGDYGAFIQTRIVPKNDQSSMKHPTRVYGDISR